MSKEILKALMQLFAIIAFQDIEEIDDARRYVLNFLSKQVQPRDVDEYIKLFDTRIEKSRNRYKKKANKELTSMTDSVHILKICKRINKTLDYYQKLIATIRLLEMVSTQNLGKVQMEIIRTISDVFNINNSEYEQLSELTNPIVQINNCNTNVLCISSEDLDKCNHIFSDNIDGRIVFLYFESTNLFIVRYDGNQELRMNCLPMAKEICHVFSPGSTIKSPTGKPIYFSDIYESFNSHKNTTKISFTADNISYKFENGNYGIQNMSIREQQNTLIAIMGASGAGKTTLLNVLSGNNKPNTGSIKINGFDLHKDKQKLKGVIGYIPQDDLLIENLTVYENLYYNSLLCFSNKNKKWITDKVIDTLRSLGLYNIKDLQVGSPLNNLISGGQRKRLNIALELIREPSILFIDEPTSGLASRDSENVMDLLREISLKGKLIFVVIHQPSSDIYRIFDKIIMLDDGGYLIQNGNPVDIISYFKQKDGQASHDNAQCSSCGNVNPEQIFNIIHSEIVDEFGNYSKKRKKSPKDWSDFYTKDLDLAEIEVENNAPLQTLGIPSKIKQAWVYFMRDIKSKSRNKAYTIIALLGAPLLAIILTTIIRYTPSGSVYIFRLNENLPQYIFMSIIVSMFIGSTLSAEEIFKDRKILKREAFLNLSKSSYLLAKIVVLLIISAIQALLFVVVGNYIFGIYGLMFIYWLTFLSISFFSNILGLVISSSFNQIVTIYIIIPILIIPQMILGGAMFSFDKMNKDIVRVDKVPLIAEVMATKWAYEALMVYQYKNNKFEKHFYKLEKNESRADFYQVYYVPELQKYLDKSIKLYTSKTKNTTYNNAIELLINEYNTQVLKNPSLHSKEIANTTIDNIEPIFFTEYKSFIDKLESIYAHDFYMAHTALSRDLEYYLKTQKDKYYSLRNKYHNEAVGDIVTQFYEKHKIININNHLIQHVDAIYHDPIVESYFDFSSHLFAPKKHFMGKYYETFSFNISIIWLMNILMLFLLRFDLLRRLLNLKLFNNRIFNKTIKRT